MVHFHVDCDVRMWQITASCKLNSAIQQKFPLEISEIIRAEWDVSKRRGFRVRDGVRVNPNPNPNPTLTLTLPNPNPKTVFLKKKKKNRWTPSPASRFADTLPNGTIHSVCTDPSQATVPWLIVFLQTGYKGAAQGTTILSEMKRDISVRPTEMTETVKVDHLH